MKQILTITLLSCGLLISCYKPYTASIKANENILVVDGMITNEVASYHIRLSYASPFNSGSEGSNLNSAIVSVSDDLGNTYHFREKSSGNYVSDSTIFTARPGRTYVLSIETPDGEKYNSDRQEMKSAYSPDTIYAKLDYLQTITRFGQTVNTVRGADIMVDISIHSDTIPGFRIAASIVKQYFYTQAIPPPGFDPPLYLFYCWKTENANSDINLTHAEYSTNSSSVNRHPVYFLDEQVYVEGLVYSLGYRQPDQSYTALPTNYRQIYSVSRRILYLNQYSLNDATYQYYKSMDELLSSEGKLFDPIATQLGGNIKCTTDPGKKVFGFFETSAVSHSAYSISYRDQHDKYTIVKRPFTRPVTANGCLINKMPPFWIL